MALFTLETTILLISCLIILILITKWASSSKAKRQLRPPPPSPFGWPLIGNASILLSKEPHKTFLDLTRRHGPVFTIAIGPVGVLCLTKYDVIKEALVKQGDTFAGRPRLHAMASSERGHNGIVLVDGPGWNVHRRFSLQTLKEFGVGRTVMEENILAEADQLRRTLGEYSIDGRVCDLSSHLELCVSNILAGVIFGRTFQRDDEEFGQFLRAVDDSFEIAVSFGAGLWETMPWLSSVPIVRRWIGFERMLRVDKVISGFLRRRMSECERRWKDDGENEVRDLTTAFFKEMREKATDDNRDLYNERQWLAVINDLWIAGIETTMVALNWVFFYLCLHPHVQTEIHREIDRTIGRERAPSLCDRASMPYTQAALCECLRFANMIPFNILHRVRKDTELCGYHIREGTWVLAQICAVLWDPDVFPEPDRFEPRRFLDDQGRVRVPEQFIPFSIGKRSCLGESLAKAEMFLILTHLLRVYTFRFDPDRPIPDVRGVMGLTKKPNPYYCVVESR